MFSIIYLCYVKCHTQWAWVTYGKTGKSINTSVVYGLHTSQLFCYSRQKFGPSISAGSFIALNSQSNAIGSRKSEPVWRSQRILDAMFYTRGHKLLSLVPSLPQLLFSATSIFASQAGCFMFAWVYFFQIPK